MKWKTIRISKTPKDITMIFLKKVNQLSLAQPYGPWTIILTIIIQICLRGIVDLMGDLIRQMPKETDGVESIVVVDGVPQVGSDRKDKLQTVLRKLFLKSGTVTNEYYPSTSDGSTKG